VVVRYLTDDPPDMAERAASLIDGDAPAALLPLVLVESAYVLMSVYGIERGAVAEALVDLVMRRNITCAGLDKAIVTRSLQLAGVSSRVSFADAMIWAEALEAGASVVTFDRSFPADGLEVIEPA
jgi:predicted nucleic-acid-binding protein